MAGLLLASGRRGAAEDFELTVDPEASHLELATSAFDGLDFVPAEPQGSNSLRAAVSGTLRLRREAGMVQVLPGSELRVAEDGAWLPGPYLRDPGNPRAWNPVPGPAGFAYRYTAPFELLVAARGLVFALADDAPRPLGDDGAFAATNLVVTVAAGTGDLTLGNPPQSDLTTYPPAATTATNLARLAAAPGGTTLELPLAFGWTITGGILLRSDYSGRIVARTAAPVLSVRRAGDTVRVSWPAAGSDGFALEVRPEAGAWSSVPEPPVRDGAEWRVELTPAGTAAWFRLRR